MPSKSAQITQPDSIRSMPQSLASTSLKDESNPTTATHERSAANNLMTPRIHHVALQTANFDQAIKFYTELFGAELLVRRPFKRREMAWLKIGGIQLELFCVRAGERLIDWNDFLPGPVHLAFEVDNLDDFLDRAKTLGALLHPSHPEPFTPPVSGAGRIAYLLGPDGEEVEVREPD